jgi:hypothetical protein
MFYKQRSIRYFYLDIGAPATFNIQNAHDLSFQFFTIGITQGIATFATDGQYKHLCFLVDYNNDPTDINDPPAIWNVTNGWTNEYSAFSKKYIDSTFVLYYTTLPVSVDNLKLAIGTKYLSQDIL